MGQGFAPPNPLERGKIPSLSVSANQEGCSFAPGPERLADGPRQYTGSSTPGNPAVVASVGAAGFAIMRLALCCRGISLAQPSFSRPSVR